MNDKVLHVIPLKRCLMGLVALLDGPVALPDCILALFDCVDSTEVSNRCFNPLSAPVVWWPAVLTP